MGRRNSSRHRGCLNGGILTMTSETEERTSLSIRLASEYAVTAKTLLIPRCQLSSFPLSKTMRIMTSNTISPLLERAFYPCMHSFFKFACNIFMARDQSGFFCTKSRLLVGVKSLNTRMCSSLLVSMTTHAFQHTMSGGEKNRLIYEQGLRHCSSPTRHKDDGIDEKQEDFPLH